jgi:dihydrofolate reductase
MSDRYSGNARRKLVLFTAASLDGYLATLRHSLDWLFAVPGEGDNGTSKFFDTVDTVIMGRVTYDWIMKNDEKGMSPYKDKECFVFSRTEKENTEYVTFVHGEATQFVETLRAKGGKNIWLAGGGDLLHTFMRERLVDEIIVTIAPILLGQGIPLWKENDFQTGLVLKNIDRYNQFIELRYEVLNVRSCHNRQN